MRAAAEGRFEVDESFEEEMDFCLVCRHCESACPAGVEFGALMEFTRDRLESTRPSGPLTKLARWAGFRLTLPSRRLLSLVAGATRFAQRLGLVRLVARLGGERGAGLADLPVFPPSSERRPLPPVTPARGERTEHAAMLEGCVMPEMFGRVNRATAATLSAAGTEVSCAAGHVCCGALHAHNGDLSGARDLARKTIEAFEALEGPIVVNSAGCGAHMKEYGRLLAEDEAWRERAERFDSRVVDYTEYLSSPDRLGRLRSSLGALPGLRVTWDDPCHLCHGQQLRDPGRELIDAIEGVERVEMERPESCCGSAGIYSLLRPADSRAVLAPKIAELADTGAEVLVTANPGCQLQWAGGVHREGVSVEVLHVAELLERALEDRTQA